MAKIPHLSHQTAKLIPYPATTKTLPSFVFVYSFEAPASASNLGNLYIVVELLTGQTAGQEICDLIARSLGEHYYNHATAETEVETQFEFAVKKVNGLLKGFDDARYGQILTSLSGVVAVLSDDQLVSARAGAANICLYRGEGLHFLFSRKRSEETNRNFWFTNIAHG